MKRLARGTAAIVQLHAAMVMKAFTCVWQLPQVIYHAGAVSGAFSHAE